MKLLKLSDGTSSKVDDDQYDRLLSLNWHPHLKGYGTTSIHNKSVMLHRFIMNAPRGLDVDHINGDKLDNRVANLRLCTRSENMYNRGAPRHNTSGYKGVSRNGKYWQANIYKDKKRYFLGNFTDKLEAAKAYEAAVPRMHGPFAQRTE